MAADYGTDLELADGFELHFPVATGTRNLLRAVFRRLTTSPTDECGEIYAGRCLDVRELYAARLDPQRLQGIARQVEQACRYDERIDAATCQATMVLSSKKLNLSINLTAAAGPTFPLVLSVDNVSVEILQNGD